MHCIWLCLLECGFCWVLLLSQPARAVWIEMLCFSAYPYRPSVTACEGCVDWNTDVEMVPAYELGHSLRGLCGLKSMGILVYVSMCMSQPARAVWIEISSLKSGWAHGKSQPARAVWIEIWLISSWFTVSASHSLRGLCGLKFHILKQTVMSE